MESKMSIGPDSLASILEYIGDNLTMDDKCRVIYKCDSTFVNTWRDRCPETGAISRMCQIKNHKLLEVSVQEAICLFERKNK